MFEKYEIHHQQTVHTTKSWFVAFPFSVDNFSLAKEMQLM